jgi:hypothetical protein
LFTDVTDLRDSHMYLLAMEATDTPSSPKKWVRMLGFFH